MIKYVIDYSIKFFFFFFFFFLNVLLHFDKNVCIHLSYTFK